MRIRREISDRIFEVHKEKTCGHGVMAATVVLGDVTLVKVYQMHSERG